MYEPKEGGFMDAFYRMDGGKQTKVAILFLAICFAWGVLGFFVGDKQGYKKGRWDGLANCPVFECDPCPDVAGKLYDGPPCIYDDLMGYKRFRIVYEDGRVCYGLKPYDKVEPTLFSCIEKGK